MGRIMTVERRHGTRARYVAEKCRCGPCREANRVYYHYRKRRTLTVDAADTRAQIERLRCHGGLRSIAAATGLSRSMLAKIADGTTRRVRIDTAATIESLEPEDLPANGRLVDAAPVWRQVRQLQKAGWTKTRIAQLVTGNPDARALQLATGQVTARSAAAVASAEVFNNQFAGNGVLTCHACARPLVDHSLTERCA